MSATTFKPLNSELNSICHLLAILGVHHILHLSRIWVNNNFDHVLKQKLLVLKTYQFPEDGQQLRPKHVGALINK